MENYDRRDAGSILAHARLLLGKSLRQLHPHTATMQGKGGLGQVVEKAHFDIETNNRPTPDFEEAGVELKCTPLKELKDGSRVSKERLVLGIIDYLEEAGKTFRTSSFWTKDQHLLLMFYLHTKGVSFLDFIFNIVRLWQFPEADLKIIEDDWQKIHDKIASGQAHELSEGDTFYLAACPKGSRAGAEMRQQPGTGTLAQQRAYSLKSSYINTIILDSMLHSEMCDGMRLSQRQRAKIRQTIAKSEAIVKSIGDYGRGETFDQLVCARFAKWKGRTIEQIAAALQVEITKNPKAVTPRTCRAILGVRTPNVAEFDKAGVLMKTVRLSSDGNLKESMVFDNIDFFRLVAEREWEESALYATLTKRFLFVVFRENEDGDKGHIALEGSFFWTAPREALNKARQVWEDTKHKVQAGDYSHFTKIADGLDFHVRPKARDSHDLTPTPQGTMEKKKAFWINRAYVLRTIRDNGY